MPNPISLHIWGDLACFTRPEMKVERVSYDIITPSAARGIFEAIYWKPQIRWVIDRIRVLKPIRFTSLRRNEVGSKIPAGSAKTTMKRGSGDLALIIEDDRRQRAATLLRDVAYVIEAHFDILDESEHPAKHLDCFNRRARRGQCFHRPYLGCREFPADFSLIEPPEYPMPESELAPEQRDRDFGYMLHDIVYTPGEKKDFDTINSNTGEKLKAEARFFRAKMNDGVIDVPDLYAAEVSA